MIKSMTGYGGAKSSGGACPLSVELKSVNNRYLDTSVHLPRSFLFAEDAMKSAVQSRVFRGKVDVFVAFDSGSAEELTVTINEGLAASYKAAVDQVGAMLGLSSELTAYQLAMLNDVLTLDKREPDRKEALPSLTAVLGAALSDFDAMRIREGQRLCADISARLDTLSAHVLSIEARAPQAVAEYRERLLKKMTELLEGRQIDEARILTEAAIYADRTATDEETVRLKSHIDQMRGLLAGETPAGRKLDFIVQELNRETNTIGSKCSSGGLTRIVLDMKSEIEKIREQVQNIE
jgi:uncharacterized protein (TIGR00255 family)